MNLKNDDCDTIWRTQDEIRTVVRSSSARLLPARLCRFACRRTGRKNAVVGECIWNLSYNERRMAIELELKNTNCLLEKCYSMTDDSLKTT